MLLLTANRNKKGPDSLEQVIEEESSLTSLPVLTVGSPNRIDERVYRERCVERLVEIIIDIDKFLGTNRLFIP